MPLAPATLSACRKLSADRRRRMDDVCLAEVEQSDVYVEIIAFRLA